MLLSFWTIFWEWSWCIFRHTSSVLIIRFRKRWKGVNSSRLLYFTSLVCVQTRWKPQFPQVVTLLKLTFACGRKKYCVYSMAVMVSTDRLTAQKRERDSCEIHSGWIFFLSASLLIGLYQNEIPFSKRTSNELFSLQIYASYVAQISFYKASTKPKFLPLPASSKEWLVSNCPSVARLTNHLSNSNRCFEWWNEPEVFPTLCIMLKPLYEQWCRLRKLLLHCDPPTLRTKYTPMGLSESTINTQLFIFLWCEHFCCLMHYRFVHLKYATVTESIT